MNREILGALYGPKWRLGRSEWSDHFGTIDDIIYSLPESFSNVANGLGYLIGIVSNTIPRLSCFKEESGRNPLDVYRPL